MYNAIMACAAGAVVIAFLHRGPGPADAHQRPEFTVLYFWSIAYESV
jgi:hypothetical protein